MKGIYKITNIKTNKCYIGQSLNIEARITDHFSRLSKGIHKNEHFQSSYNLYGQDSFVYEILELTDNLNDREEYYIKKFNSSNKDFGYNIMTGGNSAPKSEEHKTKIKLSTTGRTFSDETRAKMSKSATGRRLSEEAKKKISNAVKGRKLSEETKRKIGLKSLGRVPSEETRQKISSSNKGKAAGSKNGRALDKDFCLAIYNDYLTGKFSIPELHKKWSMVKPVSDVTVGNICRKIHWSTRDINN